MPVFASEGGHNGGNITHQMMVLVLQIGVIIFAGYFGLKIAERFNIPGILGELAAGIIIGPFLLGRVPLPAFPHGLFEHSGGHVAVTPELFGFAMVASIVLLFLSGLQTDLKLFLKFAVKGGLVGIGGALVSMVAGIIVVGMKSGGNWLSPASVFVGVVAVATSVDITARILSEKNKLACPEGVTIFAASVIEDVIGITCLAVLLSIDSFIGERGVAYGAIVLVAARAFFVWLGFTVFGIVFSHKLARLLKVEKNNSQIAVLAMGLALVVSGLFETAGLAMIIGAYVVGLSLSSTDLADVIQERIEVIHNFFDPIFFTVMGMIINLEVLFSLSVLAYGLLLAALAIVAKLIGCGLPALAIGFTGKGALRISLGMMPRGEVALIIAGIGISAGLLNDMLFGVVILMTLITTMATPPLFSRAISSRGRGTRTDVDRGENVNTEFELGSRDLTRFLLTDIVNTMKHEGFYVHVAEREQQVYQMRKEMVYISLVVNDANFVFTSQKEDVTFINNLVYESILTLQSRVEHLKKISKPVELQKTLIGDTNRTAVNWFSVLDVECITLSIHAKEKEAIINELVDLLEHAGKVKDREAVLEAVQERERSMSTGMPHGIALPHGHTSGVDKLCVAAGLSKEGVDFNALDGKPSHVFFLIISPEDDPGPHLQVLSGIAGILSSDQAVQEILRSASRTDFISFMAKHSKN